MKKTKIDINSFILPAVVVVAAAALRVVPHLPNFAPITAMALFGGVYLTKRWAIVLPLLAMVVSDFVIGFDGIDGRAAIYGSFIIISLIGMWLRNHKNTVNILGATLISSLLFFLITNLTVLYTESLYPKTLSGLLESYIMGIPFFRNTVLGDLFYTGAFFGAYELISAWVKNKKLVFIGGGNHGN